MAQDIKIPDIGDADDVEVVEIIAAAGDEVGEDDPIIVIESDKASMEVPAGKAGVIDSITVSVGDKVNEGQVIAKLKDAEGGGSADEGADDDDDAGGEDANKEADEDADDQGGDAEAPDEEDESDQDDESEQDDERKAAPSGRSESRQIEVRVPDVGDAEGIEVIEVAVKAGDTVAENDVLVVVESDKASMEIPSTHAGTVKEVHVSEGSQVEQDTLLVTLESEAGEEAEPEEKPSEKPKDDKAGSSKKSKERPPAKKSAEDDEGKAASVGTKPATDDREDGDLPPTAKPPAPPAESPSSGASVYAGPAVRRLARELGVDLTAVEGTGNRGRIVKDDVKTHVKTRMKGGGGAAAGALPTMPEVDFSKFGEVEEQPLSRIRARGAENLHRSWVNVPHVTQHDEVDITDLEDFRASLKAEGERRGVKVTPLAFIIKACCQVLQEFPTFNASLDPAAKKFILKRYYHIGMAVDTPDGLVVPVIRDANTKGVWELSAEVVELAEKARDKKLGVNDMQGGSFSVSSLGAIGGTGFTPIINAPEVAILGVSRLTTRPVWKDQAFVPRKMLPLSLSYDHRAINGAEAGRFVARLGELLSDIRRLAL